MVASLQEAFGIRNFKKKKPCKKDFQKVGFTHYDNTNVYNKGAHFDDTHFDDNTNVNSNSLYDDNVYSNYTYKPKKPSRRNRIPQVLLEQSNDNPIQLGGVPIEMGAGEEPSDGDYSYAPGSQAEQEYNNYTGQPQQYNERPNEEYIQEQEPEEYSDDEEFTPVSDNDTMEGMVDYQTFEKGIQRSIKDLTDKVNKILNGSSGVPQDSLSNTADVVLYIFTGIFFLLLFDMAFKLGKMRR